LHEGHRVGFETVERTLQTKKVMPPATVITMAKTMSCPGVHMVTVDLWNARAVPCRTVARERRRSTEELHLMSFNLKSGTAIAL
jgi:hypothetical protein